MPQDQKSPRQVAAVLFDGFELLDVFGPLEMFGVLTDQFAISLIGPEPGPVRSAQGPEAAGMDMALALIARLHGDPLAAAVADGVEFEWHRDPAWDPFAAKSGLTLS